MSQDQPESNPPERVSSPQDSSLASLLPTLLDHVRLLTEILQKEQDLLLSGPPEDLEEILSRKMLASDRLSDLLARSGLGSLFEGSRESLVPLPENAPSLSELKAGLLHLSEIASVNLVIARESAQTVAGFLKALRQSEGDFETYGARGDLGMTLGSPALVSTRR
jgi:flagellar biosynthesis/type III secretory pathway chaperone